MCTQSENAESREQATSPSLSEKLYLDRINALEKRLTKLQRLVDIQEQQKDNLKLRNSELRQKVRELLSEEPNFLLDKWPYKLLVFLYRNLGTGKDTK